MKTDKSISVFFPAYNDGGTIASMVITALLTLREVTDDYEVIVINDGSADFTPHILDELARKYQEVRIVHHPRNRGYGGALCSGFANATKELVFYTDGDAQYDVRELKLLLPALHDDIDLVNGYKIERHDPFHRVVVGKLYQHFIKLAFQLRLRDVDCDFRLMRRSIFDKVQLKSNSGVICVELMKKIQDAGFRLAEVPVHHFHRAHGKSQFFNFPRVHRTLVNLTELWQELMLPKLARGRRPKSAGLEVANPSGGRTNEAL
ncbi:MAG: glycosyltransferase family 2 protein [Chloroflexi bacterium]|nr:glycosyltransferase family 2 protein [Chloroflexota bacterium]